MKTLTLLRHAKSGMDDPELRDFDRPLNAKGQRAAQAVGHRLREWGMRFDHVIASPAVRVVQTLAEIGRAYGAAIEPEWDRRAYLAAPTTLLDLIQAVPDAVSSLLVVGHNPGLEELALMLAPDRAGDRLREDIEVKFPTGSLAVLTFAVDRWADVAERCGTLTRFLRPRDLDPAFGPDQD